MSTKSSYCSIFTVAVISVAGIFYGLHHHNFKGKTDIPLIKSVFAQQIESTPHAIFQKTTDNTLKNTISTYTWGDFLVDTNCQNLRIFLKNSDSIPQLDTLHKYTYTLCQQQPDFWQYLVGEFITIKQDMIIQDILASNPPIWGYLKTIPYILFDIYHPTKLDNNLSSTLNQIQTALYHKDIDRVLESIYRLPIQQQYFLKPILDEARYLLKIKVILEQINERKSHD